MEVLKNSVHGGEGIVLRSRQDSPVIQPIRRDRLSGMSYVDIARKYLIDPRTAKRYAENNLPLSELKKRSFPSVLDPYHDFIQMWMRKERLSAATIHRKLRKMGLTCSYETVNDYVRKRFAEQNIVEEFAD